MELWFGEDDDVVTDSQLGAFLDGDQLGVADHDADPDVSDVVCEVPDGHDPSMTHLHPAVDQATLRSVDLEGTKPPHLLR